MKLTIAILNYGAFTEEIVLADFNIKAVQSQIVELFNDHGFYNNYQEEEFESFKQLFDYMVTNGLEVDFHEVDLPHNWAVLLRRSDGYSTFLEEEDLYVYEVAENRIIPIVYPQGLAKVQSSNSKEELKELFVGKDE